MAVAGAVVLFWVMVGALIMVAWLVGAYPLLSWVGDKLVPPLILAVIISWILPRALERYRGKRDAIYKTIETLRDQVHAYQRAAVAGWQSEQTQATADAIEAGLDFLAQDITALMRLLNDMGVPDLWGSQEAKGVAAVSALLSAATSGAPIVNKRKSDLSRVSRINDAAIRLSALLMKQRWEVLKMR